MTFEIKATVPLASNVRVAESAVAQFVGTKVAPVGLDAPEGTVVAAERAEDGRAILLTVQMPDEGSEALREAFHGGEFSIGPFRATP